MLINMRNAMMAGKSLPYDAEVEYLCTDGYAFINTGLTPSDSCGYSVDFMCTELNRANHIIGAADGTNRYELFVRATGEETVNMSVYFSPTVDNTNDGVPWYMRRATVDVNWLNSRVTEIDGNYLATLGTANACNRHIYLLGYNSNGTATVSRGLRVYGAKISIGSSIARDFIPVRVGTVGYMYDRVSGRLFGNDGTGDFVLGPDVVPVEWLETDGRQYIDTGVTCGSADTTVFEFDQSYSVLQSGRFVWGSNYGANQGKDADNYYVCGLNRSDVIMQAGVVYHCKTQVAPDKAIKAYINGTLFRDNTGSSPYTNSFYIFRLGGYNGGDGQPSYLRIHHLTVSINDARVRDFRPVRVGTEGAMMDVLTRRIYRNQGYGGAFAYGNDLKYPIPAE